jgi:hypothetical protein
MYVCVCVCISVEGGGGGMLTREAGVHMHNSVGVTLVVANTQIFQFWHRTHYKYISGIMDPFIIICMHKVCIVKSSH